MTASAFLLAFFALCALGLVLAWASRSQTAVVAWLGSLAAIALAMCGAWALAGRTFETVLWEIPGLTSIGVAIDALSAVFVLASGLVLLPASLYAASELREGALRGRERPFATMLFALYASIALVVVARDAILLMLGWEAMSILCYLLVADAGEPGTRAPSGYLLLAMGEAGFLASALAFALLGAHATSFDFTALRSAAAALSPAERWAIFLLAFLGFGVKAGLVPVNSWLAPAYRAAPRGFAPVLAGATLNLGLYGILRVNADLAAPLPPAAGLVALAVGAASALIGILYATTDNDLKSMLAHSSIENTGIVVAGAGAGIAFVSAGHAVLASIAFVAALYHLVNHSVYKSLLFMGVGTVEARTGTREMDRLGGLIRWMPKTALAFLVGALAISAMPPLNGFASEWLTLQALLRAAELGSTGAKLVFALSGAALALAAALAVTCFVKAFAMTFLGMRRLPEERRPTEGSTRSLAAMGLLAIACALLGVLPTYVIRALDGASVRLSAAHGADALVPPFFASAAGHDALPAPFVAEFHDLGAEVGEGVLPGRGLVVLHRGGEANPVVFAMSMSYTLPVLALLLVLAWLVLRRGLSRGSRVARRERWAGGMRRLLPELTYTATGFSNPVRVIFDAVFRPTTVEDTRETVAEHFRNAIRREKERVHVVDRLVFRPLGTASLWLARTLAGMHHGRINAYVTYAFIALLVALAVMGMG
ncbi:MAG TPA: proton-conducting transporter membrane subunit [Usitatibacter sp.]|nr:proton-conducting transporter membrane subunit [Usitatibacter sp.]